MSKRISEQALADATLGCGPAEWFTGKDDPFYPACKVHDLRYNMHKLGDNSMSCQQANEEFARNVDRIVAQLKGGAALKARAWLYKRLVNAFGPRMWAKHRSKE